MNKLELMQYNKARYEEQLLKNETMDGLSQLVGVYLMLPWIKGDKWMGGLSDSKANKAFERIMEQGYDFDEIDDEWQKQMDEFDNGALRISEAKTDKDILNEIENEIFYQFKLQDGKPVYESRPQQLSDRIQLTLRLSPYDSDHLKLGPIKKALSKFGPVKQSTFKHDRLTSGRKEVTFEIGTAEDMNENLTQYYGVDKYGKAKFVAMSEEQVKKWAENHPEDGIVSIEDSNGRRFSLSEALNLFDKREFEENSRSFELEMLYESVKTVLSAQQKNDLARFVRKAKTAEEINTYMTGMLAQNQMNEGLKIQAYGKTKRIPKSLSNYMHTGRGREMDARFLEAAIEDTMYDDDGNYTGILDADKICNELNSDKNFLYKVRPFKSTENFVRIIATDYNGNEDIISISKEANESLSENYEQRLEFIKDATYNLEDDLNNLNVWIDDIWYDGQDGTITVFVSNGDWKHDHWRLDNFLRDWIEKNNLNAEVRTRDIESDSDVYDAYHTIKFRGLTEDLTEARSKVAIPYKDKFIVMFVDHCLERFETFGDVTDAELELPKDLDTDEFWYELEDACDDNGISFDLREKEDIPNSDVMYLYFNIYKEDLQESYISQKDPAEAKFSNGQLKDFDPYKFMKQVMNSGQSLNSVRQCGNDYYTIFVSYMKHFGPKGIDDLSTLYELDIIKEDPNGDQTEELRERNLEWTDVAEKLSNWQEEKCLADKMRKNAAMPY